MSSSLQENDAGNTESNEENKKITLFDMVGSRKPQYWVCIKLIAPNSSKKKWKTTECIGAYCTICNIQLKYSQSNPSLIPRHMKRNHEDLLNEFEKNESKKRKGGHSMTISPRLVPKN